jgi:hypothetical protein
MNTELDVYQKALKELTKIHSSGHPRKEKFTGGFCKYFIDKYDYPFTIHKYPTLFSLSPIGDITDRFWFDEGDWGPRINLLIKAIKILKNTK